MNKNEKKLDLELKICFLEEKGSCYAIGLLTEIRRKIGDRIDDEIFQWLDACNAYFKFKPK